MDQRINYPLIITRISARLICYTKYNDDDYLKSKGEQGRRNLKDGRGIVLKRKERKIKEESKTRNDIKNNTLKES